MLTLVRRYSKRPKGKDLMCPPNKRIRKYRQHCTIKIILIHVRVQVRRLEHKYHVSARAGCKYKHWP